MTEFSLTWFGIDYRGHVRRLCPDTEKSAEQEARDLLERMGVPDAAMKDKCRDFTPPWFAGPWRDWHRGHGCNLDDGKPQSYAAKVEIAAQRGIDLPVPPA